MLKNRKKNRKAEEADKGIKEPTGREKRRNYYRDKILKSAKEVFIEKGFNSTTTDEIAERAGITKSTLYKYYPSKLALYVRMYDDTLHKLSLEMVKTSELDIQPVALVEQLFDKLFDFTCNNETFMRLYWMLDSIEFNGDLPRTLIQKVQEHTRTMFAAVVKVIKKAQREGKMANYDPLLLAHLISAINKGIFVHASKERRLELGDFTPEQFFRILKPILKEGLLATNKSKQQKKK